MKNQILLAVTLMMLFGSSGCMSVDLTAAGYDKTASMTSTDRKFTIMKHFSREVKCWYTLVNLIPLTQPNVAEILTEETASAHGDAVINLSIHGQTKLADAAVPVALSVLGSMASPQRGAFAGLLIGTRTYTVEGDVIHYVP